MSVFTWSALGFFLAVLLCGSAAVGYVGYGFWRQLQATLATSSQSMDDLTAGLDTLDARLVRLQGEGTELANAASRLSHSVAKARIVLAAAQEARAAIARWLQLAAWLRLLTRL